MSGRLLVAGFHVAPYLPEALVRWGLDSVFARSYRTGGRGVARLRQNYRRILPEASETELDALTLQGMREYGRYYAEAFLLKKFVRQGISSRIILENSVPEMVGKETVVAALGHTGNWDLAGAWASATYVPILTVAETLKPERVFTAFMNFRTSLGMNVIPLAKGGVVPQLLAEARRTTHVLTLLADRDLTKSGITVNLCGHPARVASGPAITALALDAPLFFIGIRSVRIPHGRRRHRWGIELSFVPIPREPEDTIETLTQRWVDAFGEYLRRYPTSWHMLQRVFVEDIEPVEQPTDPGETRA